MYQLYGSWPRTSFGLHWYFPMFFCFCSIGFCSDLYYFFLSTLSLISAFSLVKVEGKFWFRFFIFNYVSILWPIFPSKHCFSYVTYCLIYCIVIFTDFKVSYNFPCEFFFDHQLFGSLWFMFQIFGDFQIPFYFIFLI